MTRGALVGVLLTMCAATMAHAQPTTVVVAGETWTAANEGRTARFRRSDGTTLSMTAQAQETCGQRARTSPQPRPAWAPGVYWPTVDAGGGTLTLCLQSLTTTAEVVVTTPAGVAAGPGLTPMLLAIANEVRPPTEIPNLGVTIHPSAPVVTTDKSSIAFVVDGNGVVIGVSPDDKGRCGYEHGISVAGMGQVDVQATAPAGYWPTVFRKPNEATFLCFETRDAYATVFIGMTSWGPVVDDLLVELRRAVLEKLGAPLVTDAEITLPRTGQRVAPPRVGRWKVVEGARVMGARPAITGDALVSIAALGQDASYAVGVSEDGCAPGPRPLDPVIAARVFPAGLGPVWFDSTEISIQWAAHACIDAGGVPTMLSVVGRIADPKAPEGAEADQVRALLARVATSYGLAVTDDVVPSPPPYVPGGGGGRRGERGGAGSGHASMYGGMIGITPEDATRTYGGLVGANMRLTTGRSGGATVALDMELGYGDGELLGEIRGGAGVALKVPGILVDVIGGLSVGSTGPAAAFDVWGEVSLGFYARGSMLWGGAMHAWGAEGPSHDRFEVRLALPKHGSFVSWMVGIRYLDFGDTSSNMQPNGDALLVTFGAGFARLN